MSATAGSDAQGRRIAPGFPLLATGTAAASIAFFLWRMSHSAYTPDFPWLWRAGQHILETGRLPAGDVFSWTRQGEPWVLYQWLFEVALAQGEALLGLRGLFALFTVAAIAIYLVAPLYGAVPRRVAPAFVLMPGALALAVASVNLSLRPMIVTSACLLAQYWMVQRLRRGESNLRATVLLLLPLYLLWGNMHTGVLLGLVSLGLLAAGDLAERRRIYVFEPADPAIEGRPLAWPAYLALAGAAFAASLINPYGIGIYDYIIALSRQSYLNGLIEELRSPDFHQLRFSWFLLLVGGLLFFLTRTRRALSAGDLLHLLVFTAATLHSARFVVWAVLFYGLVLPRAIHHEWFAALGPQTGRQGAEATPQPLADGALRAAVAATCILLPVAFWLAVADDVDGDWCDPMQPAITAYLAAQRPGDRLFNDPTTGSCLLAQDPGRRVFIDTRFDFYGAPFTRQTMAALNLAPGWRRTLDAWRIDAVVLQRDAPLAQALLVVDDFVTIFEDDRGVVLRRHE